MNALVPVASELSQLPAYRQISDPLDWCTKIGQSLAITYSLNSPHHGTIMALTCLTENLSVSKYHQRYHSDGTMRAPAIQAEFQNRGGRIEWLDLGDDGKQARAKFTHPVHQVTPIEIKYTIEDAIRQVGAKMDKEGSNWKTNPGAMLRAALMRKAAKIIDPGIVSGYDEFSDIEIQPSTVTVSSAVKSRQEELAAMATESPGEAIADAEVAEQAAPFTDEPVAAQPVTEQPAESPRPVQVEKCTNEQLTELVALASKIPSPADSSRGMSLEEIAKGVCDACSVKTPEDATRDQIAKLIERFRAQLGQK